MGVFFIMLICMFLYTYTNVLCKLMKTVLCFMFIMFLCLNIEFCYVYHVYCNIVIWLLVGQ